MKYATHFSFILLLFVLSCNKPCFSPQDVSIESVPIMKYFNSYKDGSWWVYKSNNSGKRDSVYVSSYKNGLNYRASTCVSDSFRLMKVNSSELLKSFSASEMNMLIRSTEFKEVIVLIQNEYSTKEVLTNARYSFPKIEMSKITSYEFLSSITLNSSIYFNVLVLNGANFDKIYLAENIGIVGWYSNTTPVNTVYSLEKYNLN